MPRKGKKAYSVLLLYPDYISDEFGHETFYAHVWAKTVEEAISEAQAQAVEHNDIYFEDDDTNHSGEDFYVLLVIEGHHFGLSAD